MICVYLNLVFRFKGFQPRMSPEGRKLLLISLLYIKFKTRQNKIRLEIQEMTSQAYKISNYIRKKATIFSVYIVSCE